VTTLGRRWIRALLALLIGLSVGVASAATTAAEAIVSNYDVPIVARVDVHAVGDTKSGSAQFARVSEWSASPLARPRGASTTPLVSVVATEAVLEDAATAERHLARPESEHSPANDAMLGRIRSAAADGRPLHESEANFLKHEVTESGLMDGGMGSEEAHVLAGQTHPMFANYHPEVIDQFPERFNNNWRNYWGMEPR
jgi:hypothetical protein